jgi:hypothetical protein
VVFAPALRKGCDKGSSGPAHDQHKAAPSEQRQLGCSPWPNLPRSDIVPRGRDGLLPFHQTPHLLNTAAGLASGHPQCGSSPRPLAPESLPLSAITLAPVALRARVCTACRRASAGIYRGLGLSAGSPRRPLPASASGLEALPAVSARP